MFQGRFRQKEVVSSVYIRSSSHRVDLKRFVPFKVVRKDVEKVKDLHIAAGWRKDPQNLTKRQTGC